METCQKCGFPCTQEADIEAIREWGYCLMCDKLDGEKDTCLTPAQEKELALELED